MPDVTMGTVTAEVRADTSQYDASIKKSSELTTATSRANEAAAKKAAAAQAFAAKFAGDVISEQSIRNVRSMKEEAAARADLRKAQSLARFEYGGEAASVQLVAAAHQRLEAAILATAAANKLASGSTHAYVSQQMAASAAIRTMDGNPGIRSIERFITTIPGMGTALQAIFPFIGAAGLAGLAVAAGEKLYEIGSKATHAGEATKEAFADIHDKAQINIDDLSVTNDKLQDEIDKISKHPNNGLVTALDEARKMADKLLDSLQADRKELEALLKDNSVGSFGSLLSGVASTGKQDSQLLQDQKGLTGAVRRANDSYDEALAVTKDPAKIKEATGVRNAAVRAAYSSQIATYKTEAARLRKEQADSEADAASAASSGEGSVAVDPLNNSAKIANVEGRAQQLADALRVEQLNESIASREATVGGLKKDKTAGGDKAAEDLMRQMELERDKEEQLGASSEDKRNLLWASADAEFWSARIDQFKKGSTQYLEIFKKITDDEKKMSEEALAARREQREKAIKLLALPAPKEVTDGAEGKLYEKEQTGIFAAGSARSDAANELAAAQQRNDAKLQELSVNEEMGHTITRQAAAMQLAAIHTASYGDELDRLKAKAADIVNSTQSDAEKASKLGKINVEGDNLQTSRSEQIMRDNVATGGQDSSSLVGAKDALDTFTNSTNDSTKAMQTFVSGTLNSLNSTILKDLTEKNYQRRGAWEDMGKGVFTGIAGGALKKGESSLLSGLGFGSKQAPKGTAGDPMHVLIGNMPAMGTGGMVMSPQALGQMLGDPSSNAKSPAGGLVSSLLPMIPGFADGGAVSAGTLAMVGERGPELVRFGSDAHITPNHKLSSGGGDTHFHVDARGSSDPAQTMAMVRRGIMEAAPHIMAGANMKSRDRNSRLAPSARSG
jgi:hypothetical protein